MSARRSAAVAVSAVVATSLLVVLLAAWAASIGPSRVLTGPGPSPAGTPTESVRTTPPAGTVEPGSVDERRSTPPWVQVLALLVDVAVAVVVVVLLLRYVVVPIGRARVRLRRERLRRRRGGPESDDFALLQPADVVARAMLEDADAQREELRLVGTPRNAVVACWHRFETQAAAAGVSRQPWETSSEYTMRVLDLVDAHQPAVSRLGALYREARFSEHELTEAHRAEALAALDTVHRTIALPALGATR